MGREILEKYKQTMGKYVWLYLKGMKALNKEGHCIMKKMTFYNKDIAEQCTPQKLINKNSN